MIGNSAAAPLRFTILGPLRAFRGTTPVDLGPPKQQALLALLLLNAGRPVPMPRIIAVLWGGDPPDGGADVVQRFVGALRRTLGPSLIRFTENGYVLDAPEEAVDAAVFLTALSRARDGQHTDDVRQALDLWQGEPLAGLTGPVFAQARARLIEQHAGAGRLLAAPTGSTATPTPPHTPSSEIQPQPEPAPVPSPTPAPVTAPTPAPVTAPTPAPAPAPALAPASASAPASAPASASASASASVRTRVMPVPAPTRPAPITPAPTRLMPPDPSRTGPPPTRAIDNDEPGHTRPFPVDPAYPDPVDPWTGHDLFPPDPTAMP
ncbi:AfsR/SARP family transcriptional regulator [Actinoplanes rectilineatus]|uniref:AfsR/SARP family transcriptional regulator n=1 Tax=Actinoplanes rectilineatus TaxID=113571 RepID=UPI000697AC39|nr:winged helix-turn-helix domain-containing protein [Actinoplanes rectilineatus]